jgi:ATP-binding cassette, subfamily B, bacterial PglK
MNLSSLLKELWRHFELNRRTQYILLMLLMLISVFAEVLSLGAVVPFLGILVEPEQVFNHSFLTEYMQYFNIVSADQLVLPVTIIFVILAIVAGIIRLLLLWFSTRLAFVSGADISLKVYKRTLYQPYHVHISRNTSDVVSGIVNRVNGVVFWVILPILTLVSSAVLIVAIIATLVIIDPFVALTGVAGFGISYGLITFFTKKKLLDNGNCINTEQTNVIKVLQEGLGGVRDVQLDGTYEFYCDSFHKADKRLRQAYGDNNFIGGFPRPSMEALGMVLIAILAYILSQQEGGIVSSMPALGALAVGSQRLLPALQQAYAAWANLVGGYAALSDTIDFLNQKIPAELESAIPNPLSFNHDIVLDKVRFKYTNKQSLILDDLSLSIQKGSRVGIVGGTGSGKSTAVDIIMGLITPNKGNILVDGISINKSNIRAWQRNISHVPQFIFLSDNSIAENIAFGVTPEMIDMDHVKLAASKAKLNDLIDMLPEGYDTYVGERGIKLSGGQRQRIGIARALYKDATVLILDEATSSLDNMTEKYVMESVNELSQDLTVIIIAHRLSTVKNCDVIFEIDKGVVVAYGSYKHLVKTSPSFKEMSQAGDDL